MYHVDKQVHVIICEHVFSTDGSFCQSNSVLEALHEFLLVLLL